MNYQDREIINELGKELSGQGKNYQDRENNVLSHPPWYAVRLEASKRESVQQI